LGMTNSLIAILVIISTHWTLLFFYRGYSQSSETISALEVEALVKIVFSRY